MCGCVKVLISAHKKQSAALEERDRGCLVLTKQYCNSKALLQEEETETCCLSLSRGCMGVTKINKRVLELVTHCQISGVLASALTESHLCSNKWIGRLYFHLSSLGT